MQACELVAALKADSEGTVIDVYAQPRASRDRIVGIHDGMLKIAVAAPPVDGAANRALIRFLATQIGARRGDLRLQAGASGRRKRVHVTGVDPEEIVRRLMSPGAS